MTKRINIASVFSGIGAFEQALKQLKIPYNVIFACDNGEREIKLSISQISQLCANLSVEEKKSFTEALYNFSTKATKSNLKTTFDELLDSIMNGCGSSIKKFEVPIECIEILTRGLSARQRESYVSSLYDLTGTINYVKPSYLANFELNGDDWHEDIRFLDGTEYSGKVDILVGGSPCQSFSTYGKKRGLEDTRGTLFYDYARVIKEIQPKVFIYENVKNVLRNDNGRTWEIMMEVWESLGYKLYYDVLNAQDYGTPQLRQRLFLIGFRQDVIANKTFKFPPKQKLTHFSTEYLESNVDAKYYLGKKGFEWVTTPAKNLRRSRVNQDIIGCQTANQQDNWIGDFRVEKVQEWHRQNPKIHIGIYDGEECVARKMTPTECLRLMGFKFFTQVVDDKRMYRQAGNSIVVSVLEALIKSIKPLIR